MCALLRFLGAIIGSRTIHYSTAWAVLQTAVYLATVLEVSLGPVIRADGAVVEEGVADSIGELRASVSAAVPCRSSSHPTCQVFSPEALRIMMKTTPGLFTSCTGASAGEATDVLRVCHLRAAN